MSDLSDKLERIEKLSGDLDIQSLLYDVYTILENPIAMFDTEYRLQAYIRVVTDDPIWNELVTHGTFGYETQVLFAEEGFIDDVANARTAVLLTSDKLKYDRISGKLFNGDKIQVANLIIVACNRPFNDDDFTLFEAVCKRFSTKIINNEFYKTYGDAYQETYIKKLIDSEITDKAVYAAHIAIVYTGFQYGMRLVLADVGRSCPGECAAPEYFKNLLRQAEDEFKYAVYSNYVLIIINSNGGEFEAKRDLGKIYDIFNANNIYAGVSTSFDNMYELRKYYLEALCALNHGLSGDTGERLFLYDKNLCAK